MFSLLNQVQLEDGLVGDPLEKATLQAIDWTVTKGDAVVSKKAKLPGMKIFHRHHFSSALKRMCVVAGYTQPGQSEVTYIATVKGAPETLRPMFNSIPDNYDDVYLTLSRRGARVLALGIKEIKRLSNPSQAREVPREELESGLDFAGFVIISCPLKADSKAVIKELLNSSHHVVMITGDNPLTACHVARELRFTRHKSTLILTLTEEKQSWHWESVDRQTSYPIDILKDKSAWKEKILAKHDLCLTGDALDHLVNNYMDVKELRRVLPFVKVYARFDPKQKEFVITSLRDLGFTVLMCGDGTNDVGALKHAHVGVAILSSLPENTKAGSKKAKTEDKALAKGGPEDKLVNKKGIGKRTTDPASRYQEKLQKQQAQLQKMLDEIEEQERAAVVKLGDASIAAPFTAKQSSIICVNHVIKQGRCTLVTTLQMFKILALNALILAYSQSVLYLEGVKFSDGQATLQGILLAACFLFISRSKPLKVLSKQRPLPNIFNAYTIFTVLSQFAVHFGCLIYLVQQAMLANPR